MILKTREEVFAALGRGQEVQATVRDLGCWVTLTDKDLHCLAQDQFHKYDWRIAEPKLKEPEPLRTGALPPGTVVRCIAWAATDYLITGRRWVTGEVRVCDRWYLMRDLMEAGAEYLLPGGKDWRKCEKFNAINP